MAAKRAQGGTGPRTEQRRTERWTAAERAEWAKLRAPYDVQRFLDAVPYSTDHFARCPRRVLADRKAHCWDGALFGAAALRQQGLPPLVLDLRAVRDDDHVIVVYQRRGFWGALAKSNCSGLRWREPIYRSLRELAASYFEDYFNVEHERTLRSYSGAFDLSRFDALDWEFRDEPLEHISSRLDAARHYPLLDARQVRELQGVDDRTYAAGMLGSDEAGLFKPEPK
jgi:hypothetical protein